MKKASLVAVRGILTLLVIVGTIVGTIVLYYAVLIAFVPLSNAVDRERWITFEKDMSQLANEVEVVSGGKDVWVYEPSCFDINEGIFASAEYRCAVNMRTEMIVTDAAQIAALHDRYFNVFDTSGSLTSLGSLFKLPLLTFGKEFVVSSADKQYGAKNNSAITCNYIAKLKQLKEVRYTDNDLDTPIKTAEGTAYISFSCSGKSQGDWFGTSKLF